MTISPERLMICTRCGGGTLRTTWCDGCRNRSYGSLCSHGDPEHLHKHCQNCHYEWLEETLNADKVKCSD